MMKKPKAPSKTFPTTRDLKALGPSCRQKKRRPTGWLTALGFYCVAYCCIMFTFADSELFSLQTSSVELMTAQVS